MPKFSKARGKWEITMSASYAGKRQRFFYASEAAALQGLGEIVLKLEMGATPQPASKATRIDALAAAFTLEKKNLVGSHTQRQLVWGTNLLRKKFGHLPADKLTSEMVDAWVRSLPYTTRGKFNAFVVNRTFYNWREVTKLQPSTPFLHAPPKQDRGHRLPILTVDEAKLLISHDFPSFFKAWLIGGMFAGLRSCEIERMSYSHIDYQYSEIAITEDISKGGKASRPRQITVTDAFKRHMPQGTGMLTEGKKINKFGRYWKVCADLLGQKVFPKNICRHTYASMLLSASQNSVTTAFQMGHTSPVLLYSCYANLVTRRDSEAYWKL